MAKPVGICKSAGRSNLTGEKLTNTNSTCSTADTYPKNCVNAVLGVVDVIGFNLVYRIKKHDDLRYLALILKSLKILEHVDLCRRKLEVVAVAIICSRATGEFKVGSLGAIS